MDLLIRFAKMEDAEELLALYTPYVTDTVITFEYEVPSLEEFKDRMRQTMKKYPYLVAEQNGEILGYSCAGKPELVKSCMRHWRKYCTLRTFAIYMHALDIQRLKINI